MEVVREACQRGGLLGSRAGPEHPCPSFVEFLDSKAVSLVSQLSLHLLPTQLLRCNALLQQATHNRMMNQPS